MTFLGTCLVVIVVVHRQTYRLVSENQRSLARCNSHLQAARVKNARCCWVRLLMQSEHRAYRGRLHQVFQFSCGDIFWHPFAMVPQRLHHYKLLQAASRLTVHVHDCAARCRRSRSPLQYASHRTRKNAVQLGESTLPVKHHPRLPIARVRISNLIQPYLCEQPPGVDVFQFAMVLVGRPQQPVIVREALLKPYWHIVVKLALPFFVEVCLRSIANEFLLAHIACAFPFRLPVPFDQPVENSDLSWQMRR